MKVEDEIEQGCYLIINSEELTNEGTGWSLFDISADFSRNLFKPFYGVITIKN